MFEQGSHPFRSMPSTRWALIEEAARGIDNSQREALEALLIRYLPALRAHLAIRRRIPADRVEDLLQSFIVGKVLEKELLGHADPARGRFRNFLLTALDRFVYNQIRAEHAAVRAPGPSVLADLQEQMQLNGDQKDPLLTFEVEWAREVLRETLRRMTDSLRTSDRMDLWGIFEARLLNPILNGTPPPSYGELIKTLPFASPAQASNALITARRIFARTLRTVIGEYVRDPDQIEAELEELRHILARVSL